MEYQIKELAKLAGVTTRTLRWYDQIGILKPSRVSEGGYRIYGERELLRLQEILLYRRMDVPLKEISSLLSKNDTERRAILRMHLDRLLMERQQLDLLIETVEKSLDAENGGNAMTDSEKFHGFKETALRENEMEYGDEIRRKYGDAEVDASNAKWMAMSEERYHQMETWTEEIQDALEQAVREGADPKGEVGKKICELHRRWIMNVWTTYSRNAHVGLCHMYVMDPRFTAYYDKNVEGCAAFLRDCVVAHAHD